MGWVGICLLCQPSWPVSLCWDQWQHLCDVPGMRTVISMNCSNQVPQRSRCGGGRQAPMIRYCLLAYQYRHTILLWLESRQLRGLTRSWHVALWSLNQRLSSHSPHKRYWRPPSSPPTFTALRHSCTTHVWLVMGPEIIVLGLWNNTVEIVTVKGPCS